MSFNYSKGGFMQNIFLFKRCHSFLLLFAFFAIVNCIFCSQLAVAAGIKPISYEEIVTFAKPQWVELSANGMQLAFCVRKGSLEKNCNMDTLYLFDVKKGQQKKLTEFEEIIQAKWGNKDKDVYLLVKEEGIHKIIHYHDASLVTLVESEEPIYLFTLSPDESNLYYTVAKYCSSDELKQQEMEEGHVYDLDQDTLFKITKGDYKHKEREEVWCLNLLCKSSQLITFLPCKDIVGQYYPIFTSLHVSSDNKRFLVSFSKLGQPDLGGTPFESDVIVWDSSLKEWYDPLNDSIYIEETACWINEREFIFQQISYSDGAATQTYSIWLFDANSRQGDRLNWLDIPEEIKKFQWNKGILYGISKRNLYKIFLDEKRVEQIEIPKSFYEHLSFDEQAQYVGLISESIEHPPEIAIYDTSEKELTRLTSLNPQIEEMALGRVEEIRVKTHSGYTAKGFLIHPIGEEPGVRYPIIIGTYGFQGQFITDAEWHSSFPAQTLAGEGYLVLLLNAPGTSQGFIGDSEKARQMEGWNKLELFEQAVDLLVERGIGDPHKVGLYGWSHGAFVVNFVISHSQKFHVACLGEGGDYNPGGFWAGGNFVWPKIYECTFDGPPWGETLKNYLEFSPFFQVDKIRTPLLLEYASASGDTGFEMYIPLRYLGIPAELVIYEGEEHNFVKPKARVASMARKLEWFNFWFFDKRNPDPKKQKQYERWEKMREESVNKGLLNASLVNTML